MTPAALIALGVAAVTAAANWWARARDDRRLERVAKPLTMAALIVMALTLDPVDPTRRVWFVAAGVFSLAGDVFLMLPRDRFLQGVAAFLLAHLCYLGGLVRGDFTMAGLILGAVLMVAALAVTGRPLVAALREHHPKLLGPVTIYMAAISAMVIAAFAFGPALAAAGALLFATSDSILARDRFVQSLSWAPVAVMVTYHLGQAGLLLSLVTAA